MLIEIAMAEERFKELKKEIPNAVSIQDNEKHIMGDNWVIAVFEIENSVDAAHLFHAGINFGMQTMLNLIN